MANKSTFIAEGGNTWKSPTPISGKNAGYTPISQPYSTSYKVCTWPLTPLWSKYMYLISHLVVAPAACPLLWHLQRPHLLWSQSLLATGDHSLSLTPCPTPGQRERERKRRVCPFTTLPYSCTWVSWPHPQQIFTFQFLKENARMLITSCEFLNKIIYCMEVSVDNSSHDSVAPCIPRHQECNSLLWRHIPTPYCETITLIHYLQTSWWITSIFMRWLALRRTDCIFFTCSLWSSTAEKN